MNALPGPADLQHWSEEVARNPDSLAFLPLAKAYRRLGRREAALRLCLRGLERFPTHAEAHALLALLHMERGERDDARDAWATVLRLEPSSFEAQRGLGFVFLDAGDHAVARRHLEQAAAIRPRDRAVQEALELLHRRQAQSLERSVTRGAESEPPARPGELPVDPAKLFDPLAAETPFLGAVIMDARGLVLAGSIDGETAKAELFGAVLGAAVEEAARAADLLRLDRWRGIVLGTSTATLHLGRLGEEHFLLLAARRGAPAGWILRAARRAANLGRSFLAGES